MTLPFYTVGHSTRTIEEFVELLKIAGVELVVDIRSLRIKRFHAFSHIGCQVVARLRSPRSVSD